MRYSLEFHKLALKEWQKLDQTTQSQFKKKLTKILDNPHIPANQLRGRKNRYKIKLRQAGYRLVYEVHDNKLTILVIAIAKRDKLKIYALANQRNP